MARENMETWSRLREVNRIRAALIGALALIALSFAIAAARPAASGAAAFGEVASWGSPGAAPGSLLNPLLVGADSTTGSVYVGDYLEGESAAESKTLRVQKFSAAGSLEGLAEIPINPVATEPNGETFEGILVDHSRGLFYLLQSTGGVATRVLAFSTTPNGSQELVPATPPSFTLPTGAEALDQAEAFALDPSNGDLLVLAHEGSASGSPSVVERFAPDGSKVARKKLTDNPQFMAVGPDGTAYLVEKTVEPAIASELSPDFSTFQEIPGFKAAEELDEEISVVGVSGAGSFAYGSQLAVSPDGKFLYWKSASAASSPETRTPTLINGYSFADHSIVRRYGSLDPEPPEGTSVFNEKCVVSTFTSSLATVGEKVIVLDQGPPTTEFLLSEGIEPKFGVRVMTFGPGGSCSTAAGQPPQALLSLKQGATEVSSVAANSSVTLDPTATELPEAETKVSKLIWRIEGPGPVEEIPVTLSPEISQSSALPTLQHTFTAAGNYTVRLTLIGAARRDPERYGRAWGAPAKTLAVGIASATPTIASINPTKGPATGGTMVTITGSNLTSPTAVEFGSTPALKIEGKSDTEIVAEAPPGTAGTKADITVETAGGASAHTAADEFEWESTVAPTTPVVTSISPVKGPAAGGTAIAITGSHLTGATGVTFGGAAATSFTVVSDTRVTAVSPAGVGGTKAGVKVVTPGGTSAAVSADEFEWEAAPVVLQFALTVTKGGSGAGTVTSAPSGISCGGACSASYSEGATVTLTATPASGSVFAGWGGACSGTGTCVVALTAAKSVTATFNVPAAAGPAPSPPPGPGPSPSKPTPKPVVCKKGFKKEKVKGKVKCVKEHSTRKPKHAHKKTKKHHKSHGGKAHDGSARSVLSRFGVIDSGL
jgi:hypothetical protein